LPREKRFVEVSLVTGIQGIVVLFKDAFDLIAVDEDLFPLVREEFR